jgi:hypothetical protein
MSEWTDGYRAALADARRLAVARHPILCEAMLLLLDDLIGDALVIEREQDNRIRRRRLRADREALPLFEGTTHV